MGTFTNSSAGPDFVQLTNSAGAEITGKASDHTSFYSLTSSAGEAVNFYIDANVAGQPRYIRLINMSVCASASVALVVKVKTMIGSVERILAAYSMTLTGTQAYTERSTAYPLTEDVPPGGKLWVEVTPASACTVYCNVMGRYY